MISFLTLFLFDILLGFVPQATGCAICLFALAKQPIKSKSFLFTAGIFSAIAIGVRLICNYGLIDFGFHTILIWLIFVIVALTYNKFPIMQCTVGILISVLSIFLTEVVAALVFTLILGSEQFNAIMDNTATIEGQITRAIYGIPMNILFVIVALIIYFILDRRAKRIAARAAEGQVEETEN